MKAFRVMGRTLKATYDELFLLVLLSVLWWVAPLVVVMPAIYVMQRLSGAALPLFGIVAVVALVLASTPATVGLNRVANRMANYQRVDNSFFWEGAKQNYRRGWILFIITFIFPIGLLFNIWFYGNGQGLMKSFAALWFWVLLLLMMMAQYFFPLLWQQEDRSLILLLRNALLLTLRHPLYTFLILVFQLLVLALSTALAVPLLLLAPGMLAVASNFALTGLLQEMDMAPQPPDSHVQKRGK